MIMSKHDYKRYLLEDKKSLGAKDSFKEWLFHDIWRFQRALRRAEYWTNCHKSFAGRVLGLLFRFYSKKVGQKFGFTIPVNTFGAGLSIAHVGTIVINSHTRIGTNCRVHVCVNIGAATNNSLHVPIIGDNCYIGPGAKLYGDIIIGDNTGIGANSVVNKSFKEGNQTIAGLPARKVSDRGPMQFRSFSVTQSK
ncbi:serine acetyltransferase [Pseudoalteromonas sp. SG45-1]|nr:serine acetyltransferase [Pseudoalteromonas sp. SG45-1]